MKQCLAAVYHTPNPPTFLAFSLYLLQVLALHQNFGALLVHPYPKIVSDCTVSLDRLSPEYLVFPWLYRLSGELSSACGFLMT